MDDAGLTPYIPQFKAIVLAHLNAMPDEQWEFYRYRGHASQGVPGAIDTSFVIAADETRESLLNEAASEDGGPTIGLVIDAPRYKKYRSEIGEIEGQPVYYIENAGIYIWAKSAESTMTLSFWATFPAYPLGW